MKEKRARHVITLTLVSISLVAAAVGAVAQTTPETDAVQKRLKRARARLSLFCPASGSGAGDWARSAVAVPRDAIIPTIKVMT